MTDAELASQDWWDHYQSIVNEDDEMDVRGHDTFSSNFYVEIGSDRFLVEMHEGTIEEISPTPGMNDRWRFGVEGEREAWEEFVQETPPAFNHEILASHYRSAIKGESGHLELTGDNKVIFQNLRAFQRTLDLMRTAHNDGGDH
jgi:hypothetical protein